VEGYDGEIIKMIDFAAVRPAIIKHEHQHLSLSERKDVERILATHGYRLLREKWTRWPFCAPDRLRLDHPAAQAGADAGRDARKVAS
jgi:hypothetical protein